VRKIFEAKIWAKIPSKSETTDEPPGKSMCYFSFMIDLAILYQLMCLVGRGYQVTQGLALSQGCQEGSKICQISEISPKIGLLVNRNAI